jgi:hypothetical protein
MVYVDFDSDSVSTDQISHRLERRKTIKNDDFTNSKSAKFPEKYVVSPPYGRNRNALTVPG